jgi:hypothetical protein
MQNHLRQQNIPFLELELDIKIGQFIGERIFFYDNLAKIVLFGL